MIPYCFLPIFKKHYIINQSINQLYTCMHFTHMHGEITNKVQPLRNNGFQI